MKIKYIIIFVFLLAVQPVAAQPYQSIFATGDGDTRWLIIWNNLWGWVADTVFVEGDTVLNATDYKKISRQVFTNAIPFALMREDVNTGKVWCWYNGDSVERLSFDFSLDAGDTFDIRNFIDIGNPNYSSTNYPDSFNVVDSIRFINGLKHIYFKGYYAHKEPFAFIEGVGSNAGVLWNQYGPTIMYDQYLLCSYKNGQKTSFINKRYNGSCIGPVNVKDIPYTQYISIYPMPLPGNSTAFINNKSSTEIIKAEIISLDGKVLRTIKSSNVRSLELYNIPAGYYLVKLYANDHIIVKPMVIY